MMTSTSSPAEFYGDSTSLLSLDSSVFFSELPSICHNPLDFFIINVGGSRYALTQELLASHPETRLGKLALCTRDSALELCDDADLMENEFFFRPQLTDLQVCDELLSYWPLACKGGTVCNLVPTGD
ncbi:hypothetical protein UPYG_G00149630 [Umbra pygmaea]|uniref:Potassium channel tetramerisation-type BTB domain-containing protein n=1 Tax=Umbra pygmaea TaxID=75934 RepID=A0ABD0WWN2_UMBPY